MISNRVKDFDTSDVRKVFGRAAGTRGAINLSIGEPGFEIPYEVKEEAILNIRNGFNKYTHASGTEELRNEIAKKLAKKNNIKTSVDRIAVTPGVSGALLITTLILFDKDDEVLVMDPYFPTFPELVKLSEAKPVFIDTYPDFSLPLEKIRKAINAKTKAIIINSPNNPSGVIYSKKDIEGLSALADRHGLIVVSDEIYEDYIHEGDHFSIGSTYENSISFWGFSKSFGMTGWRLGYLSGPERFMERVHELMQYLFFSPPSIPQKAALKALEIGPPKDILAEFKKKRNVVVEGLSSKYVVKGGHGAYYLFLKVPGGDADDFLEASMRRKLFLLPGKAFSQKNTHVRLSYSADIPTLRKAVKILNSLV